MLEQENSSRSSAASRGCVKQVSSCCGSPSLCLQGKSCLWGASSSQGVQGAGLGTGRTALLPRLDSRARQGPQQASLLVDSNMKMDFSGRGNSDIAVENKKIEFFVK